MENNSAVMDGVLSDELFPLSVHGAVCVSCQSASNWFKMFFKRSDMLHLFRSGLDLCTPNKPKHISLVEQPTWLVLVKFIVITLNPAFTVTSDGFIFCARDKQERGFLRKTELFEIPLKLGMTLFKRKKKKKGSGHTWSFSMWNFHGFPFINAGDQKLHMKKFRCVTKFKFGELWHWRSYHVKTCDLFRKSEI